MTHTAENNKRIARNNLLLYFRMLLTMTVSLYTSRIVLNILGVEDFGVYNVVGGVVAMLGFVTGSLSAASSRYITYALGEGNLNNLKKTFANIQAIHLIFALILIFLAETIGLWFLNNYIQIPIGRENAVFWVFQFSIITTSLSLISVPYNASIIAHEKMSAFAYISILDVTLKLLIVFLLQVINFDKLILYAAFLCSVQVIIQITYIFYCKQHFQETLVYPKIDKSQFREIVIFAGWTMNGNLALMGFTQGLNILLNIFFGPAVNAARGIAVQVESVVRHFCSSFQMALNPQLTKSFAQKDIPQMHKLLNASSKFSFFLILFISLPACLEAKLVLQWWLGIVPEYTIIFLRLILCSCLLGALSNPIIISVHATGNLKRFQLIEGSMLLSIVPIAYIGLKFFDFPPEYVFIVHISIEIITQYARLHIVLPMIGMELKSYIKEVVYPILKVFIISPIIPIIVYMYVEVNIITFFLICILCVISTTTTIYFLGCTTNEQTFIKNKLQQFYLKIK